MGPLLWCRVYLFFTLIWTSNALRIQGVWNPGEQRLQIITKFAVQPIDPLFPQFTRGFIFGNVTNVDPNQETSDLALFIIPQTRIHDFEHGDFWHLDCKALLRNISSVLFDPKCFKNGNKRGDIMRWISCPVNGYCIDEEIHDKVIPGSQFTLRIDEPMISEFWYIVFVSCRLDSNCSWVETIRNDALNYDIRLTNGHPLLNVDILTKQFSFEEQNIFEIMLFAFGCFLVLALFQWRGTQKSRIRHSPLRVQLLSLVIGLQVAGLFIQIINMLRFIKTGLSIQTFCFLSEFLQNASDCIICLILLLLGNGWSLRKQGSRLMGNGVFYIWIVISTFNMIFFIYGYQFIENQKNYSDLLMMKTSKALISIRLIQGVWFLIEIKKSLNAEASFDRAVFLLHFGAAFMIWFTYDTLLLALSLVISEFYRLKFVIATTLFAKFIAATCLLHIFWPTGSYSRFFNSDLMMHRTFSNNSSAGDSEEFDLLMAGTLNSDDDEPDHPM